MEVRIVTFPETRVAAITHVGLPQNEHDTARKLIAWKLAHGLLDPAKYRSYGLHYTDPRTVNPREHRVDFCLSIDRAVGANPDGIHEMTIPSLRCAFARDIGSRFDNKAVAYLYDEWLPSSGELLSDAPIIFHYVNVGKTVKDEDAVTDVYMPLQ